MKNFLLSSVCFFLLLSCKTNAQETEHNSVGEIVPSDSTIVIFEDSLSLAKDETFKFLVTHTIHYNNEDESILNINLYKKIGNSWNYTQNVKETLSGISDPEIEMIDINKKGLIDISFKCALAGRGYNEIRKHYVFDKATQRLVAIKNSPEHPNLTYNEDLDCFESHIAFGGYASTFFQLEVDSLREFSSIEMYDRHRIVSVTDKKGLRTIISKIPYDLDDEDADLAYGDYDYRLLRKYKDE